MNEDANSRHTLPLDAKRRIDRVCLEFEAAWKSGQRPQIERYLSAVPLEKEPQRRYTGAAELAEELGRFLRGEPIHARPITAPGRTWRWCRRNPAVSALAAGLVVAGLAGFVGIAVQWGRAEGEAERANFTARSESLQRRKAEEATEYSRRLLYVADMMWAQQAWEAGNVERVVELLERHRQPHKEDLRGFQWHCLWRLCQRSLDTRKLPHGGPVWGIAFSPNGKTLASVAYDSPVRLWNVETGLLTEKLGEPGYGIAVAFSPDGKTLATSTSIERKVRVWDLATGQNTSTMQVDRLLFGTEFSPDGKILALTAGFTVQLWDVAKGEERKILVGHCASVNSVAFSPDGTILASGGDDSTVKLWYLGRDREPESLAADATVTSVAFSPDGNTLAAASGNSVRLWRTAEAEGSKELNVLTSLERRARRAKTLSRHSNSLKNWSSSLLNLRTSAGPDRQDSDG